MIPKGWTTTQFWASLVPMLASAALALGFVRADSYDATVSAWSDFVGRIVGAIGAIVVWWNYNSGRVSAYQAQKSVVLPVAEKPFKPIVPAIVLAVLGGLALFPSTVQAQALLPWRRDTERRLDRNEQAILKLMDQMSANQAAILRLFDKTAAPTPPSNPPIIVLPIAGDPRIKLPIEGDPKIKLPVEGDPKIKLPSEGDPKIKLPGDGKPKLELGPDGKPKLEERPTPGMAPTGPPKGYKRFTSEYYTPVYPRPPVVMERRE